MTQTLFPVLVDLPVYESREIAKLELCAGKLWPCARAVLQQTLMILGQDVFEGSLRLTLRRQRHRLSATPAKRISRQRLLPHLSKICHPHKTSQRLQKTHSVLTHFFDELRDARLCLVTFCVAALVICPVARTAARGA